MKIFKEIYSGAQSKKNKFKTHLQAINNFLYNYLEK